MTLPWLLTGWTVLALIWWLAAGFLTAGERRQRPAKQRAPSDQRFLSVFKCLAGNLSPRELERVAHCLETFVAELDPASELLIGVPGPQEGYWRRWNDLMSRRHPGAAVALVVESAPERLAPNPKISWLRLLAPHARGELWLWSDADMEAPAGTLQSLRVDFAAAHARGARMVTSPYVVHHVHGGPALLDALYVNLEHHPGALLLDRLGRMRVAFGAGMLFEAEAFRERVEWQELGECLADDFHLGQRLAPVRLGTTRLVTAPADQHWRGALLHYHRWHKTVRWCEPVGFAAQLVILPALGWLATVAAVPTAGWAWAGLAAVAAMDALAAVVVCRLADCRLPWRVAFLLPLWTVARPLAWIACWMPTPILWRGTAWRSPRQPSQHRAAGT